jgi:hypothetical protein
VTTLLKTSFEMRFRRVGGLTVRCPTSEGFGHSQRSDSLLSPQATGEFSIATADAFGLEHPHAVAVGTAANGSRK